jgi:hypothetical protein
MNTNLEQKLYPFANQITITEAWPPTVYHLDPRHASGAAVDFVLANGSIDPKQVSDLYYQLRKAGFSTIYYEAGNNGGGGDACAPYIPLKVNCITPPTNTGKSFHVAI